jgi:uncharacterized phage protein (TIGR01671 family)
MNRPIKFRVWDKRETKGMSTQNMLYDAQLHHFWQDFVDYPGYELMQYTGLNDSKGKEIYEGDIVKEHHFEDWGDKIGYEYIGIVVYKEYSDDILYAGYKTIPAKNQNTKFRGNAIQSDCEVIGNVFENSELLK